MRPSDAAWQQLISALHASGRKAALAITGGGSGAIGELLRVPGGSRLLIEAQVPYDAHGACDVSRLRAGHRHAVPIPRSRWHAAFGRARPGWCRRTPIWLASARQRHWSAIARAKASIGFHIAFANAAGIAHCTGVLAKGRRDRAAEEDLVSHAIVLWLARACGVAAPSPRSSARCRMNISRKRSSRTWIRSISSWPARSIASPPSPMAK